MKLALVYLMLVSLMYLPLLLPPTSFHGWILYTYWTLVALAAVVVAWVEVRRWR